MRFSPLSFVLGLAAASLAPVVSRVFRPLAVEAAAAGMGMFGDARRLMAEQMETLEDIVAEARARREHLDAEAAAAAVMLAGAAENGHDGNGHGSEDESVDESVGPGRTRRRAATGGARRRPS
jgi:hypothetical protein